MTTAAQRRKTENRIVMIGGAVLVGSVIFAILAGKKGKGRDTTKYGSALVVGDSLSSQPWAMGGKLQELMTKNGIPTARAFKSGKGTFYFIGEDSGWKHKLTGRGKPGRKTRPSPIQQAIRKNPAELLVVVLGANDFRLGLAEGDYRPFGLRRKGPIAPRAALYKNALAKFVEQAKGAGVKKIIWIGPSRVEDPPDKERRAARRAECPPGDKKCLKKNRMRKHGAWSNPAAMQIGAWQKEVLEPLGVEWHDSQPMTSDLSTADGIHFPKKESAAWAARAGQAMSVLPS